MEERPFQGRVSHVNYTYAALKGTLFHQCACGKSDSSEPKLLGMTANGSLEPPQDSMPAEEINNGLAGVEVVVHGADHCFREILCASGPCVPAAFNDVIDYLSAEAGH